PVFAQNLRLEGKRFSNGKGRLFYDLRCVLSAENKAYKKQEDQRRGNFFHERSDKLPANYSEKSNAFYHHTLFAAFQIPFLLPQSLRPGNYSVPESGWR